MKFVWVVGIKSCENSNIRAVCATEEIAKKELFKARDKMVRNFDYQIEAMPTIDLKSLSFYQKRKTILSNNDPRKWEDSNPYNYPYSSKMELLEE